MTASRIVIRNEYHEVSSGTVIHKVVITTESCNRLRRHHRFAMSSHIMCRRLLRNRLHPRQLNAFEGFQHSTAAGADVRDVVG